MCSEPLLDIDVLDRLESTDELAVPHVATVTTSDSRRGRGGSRSQGDGGRDRHRGKSRGDRGGGGDGDGGGDDDEEVPGDVDLVAHPLLWSGSGSGPERALSFVAPALADAWPLLKR